MSLKLTSKVEVLVTPGAIFASAITSDKVSLANSQTGKLVILSGAGDEEEITVKVIGSNASGTATKAIAEFTAVIGEGTNSEHEFTADELTHDGLDFVYITTSAVAESTIPGAIILLLDQHRYSV